MLSCVSKCVCSICRWAKQFFERAGSAESIGEVTSRETPIIATSPTAAEPTNTHPGYCPARRSRHLISTQITEELSLENKEIRIWNARRISQQTPLPADVTQFGEFLLAHMG